jgi:hypothetical protein
MNSKEIFEIIKPMLEREKPNFYHIENEILRLPNGNGKLLKEVKFLIEVLMEKRGMIV